MIPDHDELVRDTHRHEGIVNLDLPRLIDDRHIESQVGKAAL